MNGQQSSMFSCCFRGRFIALLFAAAAAFTIQKAAFAQCADNNDCKDEHYCEKAIGDCDGFGECRERPQFCPDHYDPVCGCDGNTYGNDCEAAAAGVNIIQWGECQPCRSNDDCKDSHYCAKAVGDCDGEGVCLERPIGCTDEWDPVCGCDGKTYGNACEAAAAGVSILHHGECGACVSNEDCDDDHYCAKEPGDCDGMGTCQPRPVICPRVYDPVCGCDGKTYGNDCEAAAAGVNVLHEGECPSCTHNEECGEEDYCAKAVGDCDGKGTCQPRPSGCPDVWKPVCGCDGQTYSNDCDAAAAGVNVLHKGECHSCTSNNDCDDESHYCAKKPGDCDGIGICQPRPTGCPDVWDPVCGCDGNTYSNDCDAAAAGVNVKHKGVCEDGLTLGSTLTSDDLVQIVERWRAPAPAPGIAPDTTGVMPARRPDPSDLLATLASLQHR